MPNCTYEARRPLKRHGLEYRQIEVENNDDDPFHLACPQKEIRVESAAILRAEESIDAKGRYEHALDADLIPMPRPARGGLMEFDVRADELHVSLDEDTGSRPWFDHARKIPSRRACSR
jgi:hypothetical protein